MANKSKTALKTLRLIKKEIISLLLSTTYYLVGVKISSVTPWDILYVQGGVGLTISYRFLEIEAIC